MFVARRVSGWNRRRKWELFLERLRPDASTTILDVGFNPFEATATTNYLEKHYDHLENITALGVEDPGEFSTRYPEVRAVRYDGDAFPFPDQTFDICWSNTVIEHVGDRDAQLLFLKEARRVARHVYLTTPNRHFPIEVHSRVPFLHWLPKPMFDRFLRRIGKGWAAGDYMRLLTKRELNGLLREAGFSSVEIIPNRIAGLPIDFVVLA